VWLPKLKSSFKVRPKRKLRPRLLTRVIDFSLNSVPSGWLGTHLHVHSSAESGASTVFTRSDSMWELCKASRARGVQR